MLLIFKPEMLSYQLPQIFLFPFYIIGIVPLIMLPEMFSRINWAVFILFISSLPAGKPICRNMFMNGIGDDQLKALNTHYKNEGVEARCFSYKGRNDQLKALNTHYKNEGVEARCFSYKGRSFVFKLFICHAIRRHINLVAGSPRNFWIGTIRHRSQWVLIGSARNANCHFQLLYADPVRRGNMPVGFKIHNRTTTKR